MKPLRKVLNSMLMGRSYTDRLECGHTVKRAWKAQRRRCEECLTDDPRTAWIRKTSALRPAQSERTGLDTGGPR